MKVCAIRGWKAILNIHERLLPVSPVQAGALLDTLSSPQDMLWPKEKWPAMVMDRVLGIGASGGHRAIRYTVTEYDPGRRVEFTFQPMPHLQTFRGRHFFEVIPDGNHAILRHIIDVRSNFRTWRYWKIFVEPIHDALIEDAFDKAERNLGVDNPHCSQWPLSVRFLRWLRARQAKAA